ncbi:hypothetical protein [Pseudoxanthomonas sacheonensis]|uniref:hypothetical protein n=1 Tax=Pseudoxanthomonas sacheonensis TaxID=443615 RepID=UPI0013D30254|nr:hypothetical protein [Pseudoxanthomonas sacheonensis]KAF1706686.1 hypothetical protein CSC73_14895 [Pseudoxanthomonas sacheonensis]
MNRLAPSGFPLKSLLAVVAYQSSGAILLGFALFLWFTPGHPLAAGPLSGFAKPLLVGAGIMLAIGCVWAIRVAWLATKFLIHRLRPSK